MKRDIKKLLTRGVVEVIKKDHLEETLKSGKRLRVKFGVDPTAPDLHLGHAVPLRKLRQFQDAGHQAVLIIGDFTARIGDPTGRSEERKPLTEKDIKQNMRSYLKQAAEIIDRKEVEVYYNSEWLGKSLDTIIDLLRAGTVQQVLHRADFRKRLDEGNDITLLEAFYPLFQGYDSVKVKADVEIGGTDQKFNLLMGRKVQRYFKMPEQDVITLPLLEGIDGDRKMSKSLGNYIGLTEKPNIIFGKIMSIPDRLVIKYTELLTELTLKDMKSLIISDPRGAKLKLAKVIVRTYCSELAAEKAEKEFIRVTSKKELPSKISSLRLAALELPLIDLLVQSEMASSKSEARRLVNQGGVKINSKKQKDPNKTITLNKIILLQVGKRRYLKIFPK